MGRVGSGVPIISIGHGVWWGGAKWIRWGEAVHWSFPFIYFIRTGKGKLCPLYHKFLGFIPVNQKQKCHLTHFLPTAPTHPMHAPDLDATQVSKWASSIGNYWYSYCCSGQGFSNSKIINIKFIAKWVQLSIKAIRKLLVFPRIIQV